MKLIYRLHLSFGLLLIFILAVTATLIYPLLLDTLVENQRKDLREQASRLMTSTLATPLIPAKKTEPAQLQKAIPLAPTTQAVLAAPGDKVFFSTLTEEKAKELLDIAKQVNPQTGISQGKDGKYIVEKFTLPPQSGQPMSAITAVMATPLSEVKSMQLALFQRMMIILSIGGIMAFLLSMVITRRIVKPLTELRKELKKVENRNFNEVRLIRSGGEIGEVASSVYQLAGELDKYQLSQKQFFQNASHELKTPLMSIQGYAEGIKDGIFTGERADKGLDVIVNECERLKKIVTEMILLAKLESEDVIFNMDKVPIQNLINEVIERINPLAFKKGLTIESNCKVSEKNIYIVADREKILQALINITGNATRYAKKTISINAAAGDHTIDIEITDDGEGIPKQLLPFLFQRFTKGKGGETGLGLAISRAIVERCRGQITAANLPSGGAAFILRIPRSR
ncbi:ATP-binding protein [Paenibacillus agaridevorans]|uniref:ATP-binding protein n=1 Tax=Paenibacillus agaridevorans TaxID=171404 RepID=UPI001BE4930A|nr:ATP-binding protein [Paenibacillus agaridevorans]